METPVRASPVVLVLASGRGERFIASGGTGSKLHALLAGKPVLQHTLDAVRASGLPWHLEDAGHEGMGDSIAAAVRATKEAGGWLILPGDLPLVRPETLQAVAAALSGHTVVLPHYQGRPRTSGGFCRLMPRCAACCSRDPKARPRWYGPRRGCVQLELDDPGIVTDVDTIRDLAEAERMLLRA